MPVKQQNAIPYQILEWCRWQLPPPQNQVTSLGKQLILGLVLCSKEDTVGEKKKTQNTPNIQVEGN